MEEIAVVVDSNVVFATIIREGGLNRYVVTIIPAIIPFYYPKGLREEIIRHSGEISKKNQDAS
ncbi:hypothetical protein A3L04_09385 [Thermococcus chitonophagus]|uniref:PIN domain-containing protein n=1 Tax=Thermococcus chitonophagus TaxID=54262 RepID=A0A170SKQ5_9EURY|nr:hypothetical protein [Thermococcus chitonophagus]ASJ17263.1 hypothetical protein A3L04_09385 [Thermococcus chitonophagus]CUX77884.1 hypothetical protein CHITON_1105 [Thermococcus chitonophagus]